MITYEDQRFYSSSVDQNFFCSGIIGFKKIITMVQKWPI